MSRTTKWGALCLAGGLALATTALAQEQTTTTQTTQVTDDGVSRSTKTTTIEGKVVRYEPGKTIVVLGPDNKELTYTLSSNVGACGRFGRAARVAEHRAFRQRRGDRFADHRALRDFGRSDQVRDANADYGRIR
jgi:hypothetical protein